MGPRVALIGHAFMGRAHTEAWERVARAFPEVTAPVLALLVGRDPARSAAAADRLGFGEWSTDWRASVARDDIDIVDICLPGSYHASVAVAALGAGKHTLCEKPLANTAEEARDMAGAASAAARAGAVAMVGFNYRRLPAIALARSWVAGGRIGRLFHIRAAYLQDWLVSPQAPLTWRLRRERAGSGTLGDLGSHIVDLAQFLSSQRVDSVVAACDTFVRWRPMDVLPDGPASAPGQAAPAGDGAALGEVTVDDAAAFLARMSGGAMASFEATRYATGMKNALRMELYGSEGSLSFDLQRPNELVVSAAGTGGGLTTVLVTEASHPYLTGWWPPGHVLGWEHSFVHQARDFLAAIATGSQVEPSFSDGLAVQEVLAAVGRSAASGRWEAPEQVAPGSPGPDGAGPDGAGPDDKMGVNR
ncbi:MAG: Gfo/Idh/MocA family protein [Acidimicrobiales bacterium]